jgi:hypothetical protein
VPSGDLPAWIETLRARLALGQLRDVEPFELPDGTVVRHPHAYAEQLLAEVDHYRSLGRPTRTLPQVVEVQQQIAAELEALRDRLDGGRERPERRCAARPTGRGASRGPRP